jgi:mono/diheme cytochrome c family protein
MTVRLRLASLLACGISLAVVTSGHDVITTPITYAREVSRLVYAHCASCHRPGGTAFSLMTYAEARPWAAAIKEEVLERRMPPWGAVKGFGEFKDDQGLTQEQIELIAEWVEGGAPEGDPKLLPKIPEFATGPPAATPPGIPIEGALTLKTGITLAGIQPQKVLDGGSVIVTAIRPDGSIEPLLWLHNYKLQFPHIYWYRAGVRLEAATRIEVAPPGAAMVALITKQRLRP